MESSHTQHTGSGWVCVRVNSFPFLLTQLKAVWINITYVRLPTEVCAAMAHTALKDE